MPIIATITADAFSYNTMYICINIAKYLVVTGLIFVASR